VWGGEDGVLIVRDVPIHIEDTVVLTETGFESLNRFRHDMLVV
jgi:Xaa-Pro aminopeptidase